MPLSNILVSGAFASLGGLFGKLSGQQLVAHTLVNFGIKLVCFLLMLGFNGAMWTLYVKGLQDCSSFKATVISSSVNFFLSGLFGVFIFGEAAGWLWWIGIFCVLFGLTLLHASSDEVKEN